MQNLSRTTFRSGSGPIVVTPHEGELRFLEEPAKSLGSHEERLAVSQSIAARLNVIVVLKGHRTIVASPSGESWVDEIGGPELATAGSGDILAGLIGSILVACKDGKDPFDLVCRSVTLHSRAGMLAKKRYQVVTALEILECLALV
jgi:NAD(P)H-hydrate repair Nnr-like enzyme with NAD(P)H-hydrate dehydratase domain